MSTNSQDQDAELWRVFVQGAQRPTYLTGDEYEIAGLRAVAAAAWERGRRETISDHGTILSGFADRSNPYSVNALIYRHESENRNDRTDPRPRHAPPRRRDRLLNP